MEHIKQQKSYKKNKSRCSTYNQRNFNRWFRMDRWNNTYSKADIESKMNEMANEPEQSQYAEQEEMLIHQ